mmetsp:Transcript_22580/g.56661  ORF Transcript_22580/g.56661 Transcript_22580/m.56661 type:complete len:203 (-) Transcript_22580:337-945(-)
MHAVFLHSSSKLRAAAAATLTVLLPIETLPSGIFGVIFMSILAFVVSTLTLVEELLLSLEGVLSSTSELLLTLEEESLFFCLSPPSLIETFTGFSSVNPSTVLLPFFATISLLGAPKSSVTRPLIAVMEVVHPNIGEPSFSLMISTSLFRSSVSSSYANGKCVSTISSTIVFSTPGATTNRAWLPGTPTLLKSCQSSSLRTP